MTECGRQSLKCSQLALHRNACQPLPGIHGRRVSPPPPPRACRPVCLNGLVCAFRVLPTRDQTGFRFRLRPSRESSTRRHRAHGRCRRVQRSRSRHPSCSLLTFSRPSFCPFLGDTRTRLSVFVRIHACVFLRVYMRTFASHRHCRGWKLIICFLSDGRFLSEAVYLVTVLILSP